MAQKIITYTQGKGFFAETERSLDKEGNETCYKCMSLVSMKDAISGLEKHLNELKQ